MGSKLDEIIKSRRPPGASVFKERVVHNLSQWPQVISSAQEHKDAMTRAGAFVIVVDGRTPSLEKCRYLMVFAPRNKQVCG